MRIKNLISRCIVNLLDSSGFNVSGLTNETISGIEHLQEFGFASKMPSGENANGIMVHYREDRGDSSLLVLEVPKYKPSLQEGESAIFNAHSAIVLLDKEGVVKLNGDINDGLVKINELTAELNRLNTAFNGHQHIGVTLGSDPTPTISIPNPPFQKVVYENDKVKH